MSVATALAELEDARAAIEAAIAEIRALEPLPAPDVPAPAPAPQPPQVPAPAVAHGLSDPKAFFDAVRQTKALGPDLSTDEVGGCEAILAAFAGLPLAWCAYGLATPIVEVNGTMQPIKEFGGEAYFRRMYDIQGERPAKARELGNLTPGDGARYCGRGYVQLTGRNNYLRAGQALRLPLVDDPDLALRPDVAAQVMRRGMAEGWFTGKSLGTYLPAEADIHQFANARRIINGLDRAVEIAGYALEFQAALQTGGWK